MFKYRVWDKKKCKWEENVYMDSSGCLFRMDTVYSETEVEYLDGKDHDVNIASGLKDKHKKEIYQNDILRCIGDDLWIVVWHAGSICIVTEYSLRKDVGWFEPHDIRKITSDKVVVGNLYEHKHLLKGFK